MVKKLLLLMFVSVFALGGCKKEDKVKQEEFSLIGTWRTSEPADGDELKFIDKNTFEEKKATVELTSNDKTKTAICVDFLMKGIYQFDSDKKTGLLTYTEIDKNNIIARKVVYDKKIYNDFKSFLTEHEKEFSTDLQDMNTSLLTLRFEIKEKELITKDGEHVISTYKKL